MEPTEISIPHGHGLRSLDGLRLPATKDEALAWAEDHGATAVTLEFLEALPAAIFHTEDGLRHAFSTFEDREIEGLHPDAPVTEDGQSD